MKNKEKNIAFFAVVLTPALFGCTRVDPMYSVIPAVEYSNRIRAEQNMVAMSANKRAFYQQQPQRAMMKPTGLSAQIAGQGQGQVRFINDVKDLNEPLPGPDTVHNLDQPGEGYQVYESSAPDTRDYNGPLSLGDPGVTASLWKESRGANDIFRDQRAWQPMDLLTIVVTENSEGSKEADTEVKSKSTIQLGIEQLFSIDDDIIKSNPDTIDPSNMVQASSVNDFKGEGETTRKGKLTARISAMVAEVLPSGVLRIEGEKIISVNKEEQIMVISGLVRPRDITSNNEVDSSKIASLRIDYYGKGIVGEAQFGGWLGRIFRIIWPF